MMLDKQNLLSDYQDFATLVAGTYLSDKSIDLGAVGWLDNVSGALKTIPQGGTLALDVGRGGHPELYIKVTTAFTGGTAVQFKLVSAKDLALTDTVTTVAESPVLADATLVQGYRVQLNEVAQGIPWRYLGLQFVTTGTHTTGKVVAGIVSDADSAV